MDPPGNNGQVAPQSRQAADDAIQLCTSRIPRLPVFFKKDPRLWFEQLENLFALHGVTRDDTKFSYVMSHSSEEL